MPDPLYSVYRAGDHAITCFRWVSQNPAQVGDFLNFLDAGVGFEWWDIHRAVGVSHWVDFEKAAAFARKKGFRWVAQVDLNQAHEKTPWAFTGRQGHVTIWAPALILIPAVVNYVEV